MKKVTVSVGVNVHAEDIGPRSLSEEYEIILNTETLPAQIEGLAERLSGYIKLDILQAFLVAAAKTDD